MTTVGQAPESQLPMRKRKKGDVEDEDASVTTDSSVTRDLKKEYGATIGAKEPKRPISKQREIRLEQNRKAAKESRRRKKDMVEELQRSVIFFSRANGTLKQQNDELTRLLLQAQVQVAAIEGAEKAVNAPLPASAPVTEAKRAADTPIVAQPASAAAAAMAGTLPPMQPGATMQAMANFQQAASAAIQAAVQGMKSIPGVNIQTLAAPSSGLGVANSQQAYNDTMTALAMQQAAVAAATRQQQVFPFSGPVTYSAPGPAPSAKE